MSLLFRLLLVTAASLMVFSGGEAATASDTYDSSICQKSYTCGGHNIHYPFYLSNESRVVSDGVAVAYSYCGYPGMAILCDKSSATLQLGGGTNYTVLAIDYSNHTITLADADALAGICPRVRHNVTIPREAWLDFTTTGNNTISFFLDCAFTAANPPPPDIIPINCTGFASPSASFLVPQLGAPDGDWFRACAEVYVAPVQTEWLASPEYRGRLGSGGYGEVLRRGFQLSWDPSAGPCYECEMSGGQCGYDQAGGFLSCLCSDGRVRGPDCVIIACSSGILVLCLLSIACLLGYKAYRSKRRLKERPRIESFLQKSAAVYPKRYTYAQVKKMTGTFAEKLGQGGFGVVYRGGLSGGRQIAVKMLKDSKADDEEFINEVASISTTSHVNVVTLLGFCLEGSKRALIYDYMPNGSLEMYAFKRNSNGEKTLSWEKLFDIAVGIARGLEYLHRGCNTRIVHFDIKPHNILLDQDFCPKISYFRMAKLCLNKESVISIGGARGTIGYIAPEVYSKQFGPVSSKSDVYSYGMMVLEMVGARDKNINANSERSSQYFPQWIYENLDEYCFSASEINSEITEIVRKMIIIGLWCIQLSAGNRPTMTRVVEMLEGSTGCLELPPQVLIS